MTKLNVETLAIGPIETNCYVVWPEDEPDAWIIDPGGPAGPIVEVIERRHLRPQKIIITHGHLDHFLGNQELKRKYPGLSIAIHKLDADIMPDSQKNMSRMFLGGSLVCPPADEHLTDGQALKLGSLTFTVIHTPGHTAGGICLYRGQSEDKVLFSGDLIFAGGGVGRTDFPGSSTEQLWASIAKIFKMLPEETIVYPGHGPATTMGDEKKYLG